MSDATASPPAKPAAAAPPAVPALPGITRDQVMALALRRYDGPINLVDNPEALAAARRDLHHETIVGFDTETQPSFRKGVNHLPCLVQVATVHTVHLFPVRRFDAAVVLREMLESPRTIKAGIALGRDLRELQQLFPFTAHGMLDLGEVAQRHGLVQSGLRNLVAMFLGYRLSKQARTSNWSRATLSPAQLTYAATDAWACRELYLHFRHKHWC